MSNLETVYCKYNNPQGAYAMSPEFKNLEGSGSWNDEVEEDPQSHEMCQSPMSECLYCLKRTSFTKSEKGLICDSCKKTHKNQEE